MRFYFYSWKNISHRVYLVGLATVLFASGLFFAGHIKPVSYTPPIYQGSSKLKEVSLTVNVFWGEEYIPQMLDILKQYNVKATFFLGGTWVKQYPELANNIAQQGHEIGSHGYSHPHPDRLSKSGNLKDIQKAEEVIIQATGVKPKLYAPPYGERGPAVLQAADEASYRTILWSVDTIDWQLPPPEVIVNRVTEKVSNGAIILMHPTAPTVKALPQIIERLKKEGYQMVPVSKLIEELEATDSSVRGQKVTI